MSLFRREDIAQWSTPWQLRRAGLFGETGLFLGTVGGHDLWHNGPEHVLIVGLTQSRKTSSFVYPNLLSWQQSVIIHDPKYELVPETAGWRGTFSRVVVLAPTSATSGRYNLLAAIRWGTDEEVQDVNLVSKMLIDPDGKGTDHMSGTEKHFHGMASIALDGFLLWGLYTQQARCLGAVRALYMQDSLVKHAKAMQKYPHTLIQEAGKVLAQTDGQNERSGIFSTVALSLWTYSDPYIQRATDTSDFTLRDLRERTRPMSLYLHVPFQHQARLRPWLRTVIKQTCDYCTSRKEGWTWGMLGMIDEVPSVKRLLFLSDGLNYVAGFGFRLALITPSMKEIDETFGRNHNLMEGCGIKIICGLEDDKVAEQFSNGLGETEVKRSRKIGRGTWTTERVKEALLSATGLMGLPPHQALVTARTPRGRQKVVVRKAYYKERSEWHARSQMCWG